MYRTRILAHVLLLLLLVRSTHGLAPIRSLKPQGGSHRHASNRKQNKVMTLHQSSATASASINQDNSSPEQQKNKKSSAIVAATFNLIKACVGSGVLALPAGLALMTDLPKA